MLTDQSRYATGSLSFGHWFCKWLTCCHHVFAHEVLCCCVSSSGPNSLKLVLCTNVFEHDSSSVSPPLPLSCNMDPSNFWTQLSLATATGDDNSPPANGVVLENTLLHANVMILKNMLWKEVNDYNAAVVPIASAHQPGSLLAVTTPRIIMGIHYSRIGCFRG